MSVMYCNTYWLLGDGADEEAKRWVAHDDRKEIVFSSPKAVQLFECGKYLAPRLPIPPEPFTIVVISDNDCSFEISRGISDWIGGGWVENAEEKTEPDGGTSIPAKEEAGGPSESKVPLVASQAIADSLAEKDFLDELKKLQ